MNLDPSHLIAAFLGSTAIGAMGVEFVKGRFAARAKREEAAPAIAVAQIEANAATDKEEITGSFSIAKEAMARMDRIEAAARDERRTCDARINALETAAFNERKECARQLDGMRGEIRAVVMERDSMAQRISQLERRTPVPTP